MPKSKADKLYSEDKRIPNRAARNGGDPMKGADEAVDMIIEDEVTGKSVNRDVSKKGPDQRKIADEARKKAKSERMYKDKK